MRSRLGGLASNASILRRFPRIKEDEGVKRISVGGFRTFYDKIKEENNQIDEGPGTMFKGLPRSPRPQKIPEALREGSREAVNKAEGISLGFLLFFVILMVGLALFLDPYRQEVRTRPYNEGMVRIGYIGEGNER